MKNSKWLSIVLFSLFFFSCSKNQINVIANDNLNRDDFIIELEVLMDAKLLTKYNIFESGTFNDIPNAYGENDWRIYYKDSLIFEFRHFKTNRNEYHDYIFEFEQINDRIVCDVSILGTNELSVNNKNQ
ncbi:hypothetical protein [Aquimarina megaterium]|uniref:hypothetical protein n=1 Tax=Aquimarina megaterium TaxID=1443666 RepID=UPI000944EB8A|nr:hypothetical protein [Aquimarina megaterium]